MLDPDAGKMIRNTDVEIRDNREKRGGVHIPVVTSAALTAALRVMSAA
jgi:hypothetical protein